MDTTRESTPLAKGFFCSCGTWREFPLWVYAHWMEEVVTTCGACGRHWTVRRGYAEEIAMEIKVGDTLFLRTEYSYQEYRIVGETSRSWLVRTPEMKDSQWIEDRKLPKTLKGYTQGTAYDMKLLQWALDNRWKISQALDVSMDAAAVLTCAKALKHELSLKELPTEVKDAKA